MKHLFVASLDLDNVFCIKIFPLPEFLHLFSDMLPLLHVPRTGEPTEEEPTSVQHLVDVLTRGPMPAVANHAAAAHHPPAQALPPQGRPDHHREQDPHVHEQRDTAALRHYAPGAQQQQQHHEPQPSASPPPEFTIHKHHQRYPFQSTIASRHTPAISTRPPMNTTMPRTSSITSAIMTLLQQQPCTSSY